MKDNGLKFGRFNHRFIAAGWEVYHGGDAGTWTGLLFIGGGMRHPAPKRRASAIGMAVNV
jgi:hypothetical protein